MIQIEIKPLKDLRREIMKFADRTRLAGILNDELDLIQLDAINRAKFRCPVDSGRLRRSIGPKGKIGFDRAFGSSVTYAVDVEYGSPVPQEKAGEKSPNQGKPSTKKNPRAAIPFLRPAADEAVEAGVDRLRRKLEEKITRRT